MNYMALGTGVFILFYMRFTSSYQRKVPRQLDNEQKLAVFINKKRKYIVIGFAIFLVVNAALAGSQSGPLALGNSYVFLLKMALGGFNLLMLLILISGK